MKQILKGIGKAFLSNFSYTTVVGTGQAQGMDCNVPRFMSCPAAAVKGRAWGSMDHWSDPIGHVLCPWTPSQAHY